MKKRILIIEDEEDLLELLNFNLESQGYEVKTATTGEKGLEIIKEWHPHVLLLDLMLPNIDGIEVCRQIKTDPELFNISILMLTAKGEEEDIVLGLEAGADDYVTKPFSFKVLYARIKALLRRKEDIDSREKFTIGDLTIDPIKFEVTLKGVPLSLTPTEFKILHLLIRKPGWIFTRNQIMRHVHGEQHAATTRSVDVQIVGLRRKLGNMGKLIETVRGIGYKFINPPSQETKFFDNKEEL